MPEEFFSPPHHPVMSLRSVGSHHLKSGSHKKEKAHLDIAVEAGFFRRFLAFIRGSGAKAPIDWPSEVQDRRLGVRRCQESSNVVGVVADDIGVLPDRQLGD